MAARSGGRSALARVVSVLEAFDADNPSLTVNHLARRSGLPVPTAHRIVGEMLKLGLLERGADRKLRVGLRLWEMASVAPQARELREAAVPVMENLLTANQQQTHLSVLEGSEALVIERLWGRNMVVNFTRAGGRHPLHATTGGLVLLSHADAELQNSFLSSKPRAYTRYTPTDPSRLRRILAGVRDQGYVVCDGYLSLETVGIGVPVRSATGEVIAALSVVLLRREARPMMHVPAVMTAARNITRALVQGPARQRPPWFFPVAEIVAGAPGQPAARVQA
ncbi:IclR family transcriptional regulator [Pseudonocardia sp. CA-142604]|uniref:IclR family transcriptional regulator n=1 Tax=Pseudonocardia sp. CA-142604 TaxID=3240024 RepID=UPI003D8CE1B0